MREVGIRLARSRLGLTAWQTASCVRLILGSLRWPRDKLLCQWQLKSRTSPVTAPSLVQFAKKMTNTFTRAPRLNSGQISHDRTSTARFHACPTVSVPASAES